MLVLSRKRLEAVLIGDGIRITVIKLDRNQVRLGIEAPDHVNIAREELVRHEAGAKSGRGPSAAEAGCRTVVLS
jgi:carbon storage regulator